MSLDINIALLRKSVEWVEEQDQLPVAIRTWEQGRWVVTPEDAATIKKHFSSSGLVPQSGSASGRIAMRDTNVCGTAYCVAGKITADDLGDLVPNPDFSFLNDDYESSHQFQTLYGVGVDPSEYAQEKLGLNASQANELFASGNTAEDIRTIAEEIAGERL